ncbi:DUF2993 domain-containing protein [Spirulina sp. CCNP1310]|uniref:LmeA family phospholipid-binding protein n=1 Tax=Spirulina sp. CCNP1310 TaxID=3110249 RepID=UPI002B1F3634|nr:DUF2993 domain-containing protein [Spirulina sp. CCNP1310]
MLPASDWVSGVLAPAVGLWLRSQLDHVDHLQIQITSKNQQLLRGKISQVDLKADQAVYQGIHLSHGEMTATNIEINVGEMLKGKPFRLLAPVPVIGSVALTVGDLQASFGSKLLAQGLEEAIAQIIPPASGLQLGSIRWETANFQPDAIELQGQMADVHGQRGITLHSGLAMATPQTLRLAPLQLTLGATAHALPAFKLDLGPDIQLTLLDLTPNAIRLEGCLTIIPEPPSP